MKKHWYDYLWIAEIVYFSLGLFNILFAWLGLISMALPLGFAVFGGNKAYCNRYCGRGQLFSLLGGRLGLSRRAVPPDFLRSRAFRLGFLAFFGVMFGLMLRGTWQVFSGARDLKAAVTLLWTFRVPWGWAWHGGAPLWAAQFAFGLYSIMLTSTVLGLFTMAMFRPRSWCVYCPMGTLTQLICRAKAHDAGSEPQKTFYRTGGNHS